MAIVNGKNVNIIYLDGEKYERNWVGTNVRLPKGTMYDNPVSSGSSPLPKDYYGVIDEQISGKPIHDGETVTTDKTYVHVKVHGFSDGYYNIGDFIPINNTQTGGYRNPLSAIYVMPRKAVA